MLIKKNRWRPEADLVKSITVIILSIVVLNSLLIQAHSALWWLSGWFHPWKLTSRVSLQWYYTRDFLVKVGQSCRWIRPQRGTELQLSSVRPVSKPSVAKSLLWSLASLSVTTSSTALFHGIGKRPLLFTRGATYSDRCCCRFLTSGAWTQRGFAPSLKFRFSCRRSTRNRWLLTPLRHLLILAWSLVG